MVIPVRLEVGQVGQVMSSHSKIMNPAVGALTQFGKRTLGVSKISNDPGHTSLIPSVLPTEVILKITIQVPRITKILNLPTIIGYTSDYLKSMSDNTQYMSVNIKYW